MHEVAVNAYGELKPKCEAAAHQCNLPLLQHLQNEVMKRTGELSEEQRNELIALLQPTGCGG